VASNAGAAQHPAWYLNLTADPHVTVQLGADTFAARARTATPQEKPPLWDQMVSIFPHDDGYQATSERAIPVVILDGITP
jgi:deazaflavin-dependent oxidoreductase (nitroreductase family)